MTDPAMNPESDIEIECADCITAIKGYRATLRPGPHMIFADPPYDNEDVDFGKTRPEAALGKGHNAAYWLWTLDWIKACCDWLVDGGSMWILNWYRGESSAT